MSKFVDERVVEMSFDNKRFESNVKTSMGTIDKLKDSLDFSGTSKNINKHLNGVDTNSLTTGIGGIGKGFSALEIMGISVLANLTTRLVDFGIEIVKTISGIDQLSAGWSKFQEVSISEATLLAQGYEQNIVSDAIEDLLWFTDETSYSFTEMMNNMSKFTAAGIELDDAKNAMMGIANWAALSGQNAGVASRVMYQLSQAMGSGVIKLQDWKSIETANMATKEFKDEILNTAVAMGTLTQNVNGTYNTLTGKTFEGTQFRDFLSEGFLTSDVLTMTLEKYSSVANEVQKMMEDDSSLRTASKALEKYEKQIDLLEASITDLMTAEEKAAIQRQVDDARFGINAFRAAQEARTLTDAINAIKDAVSTGWTRIFREIFGGVEEAKKLWTDLANGLYDIFMDGMWKKIEILEVWSELGGRDDLWANTEETTGAFWNLFNAIKSIKDLIGGAWKNVFGFSDLDGDKEIDDIGNKLKNLTSQLKDWSAGVSKFFRDPTEEMNNLLLDTAASIGQIMPNVDGTYTDLEGNILDTNEALEKLKLNLKVMKHVQLGKSRELAELEKRKQILEVFTNILKGLFSTLKIIGKTVIAVAKGFSPLIEVIKSALGYLLSALGTVGKEITDFSETTDVFEKITEKIRLFSTTVINFVKTFIKYFRESLNKVVGVTDTNSEKLISFRTVIESIVNVFKWFGEIISKYVLPFLPKFFEVLGIGLGWIVGNIIKLAVSIKGIVIGFIEWLKTNQRIQNGFLKLKNVLDVVGETFKKVIKNIAEFFKSFSNSDMAPVEEFSGEVEEKFTPLKTFVEGLSILFQGLWYVIKAIVPVVGVLFSFIGKALKFVGDKLKSIFTSGDGEVNFAKLFTVGFWAVVAVGIYRFADMLRSIVTVFRDAFDSVFDYFNSKAMMQYMEAIKTMAISILLMVGALLILGAMDADVLKKSMYALGALMAFMVGVLLLMKNLAAFEIKGSLKDMLFKGSDIAAIGKAFAGIAIAILLLSYSLKIISGLDSNQMMYSLVVIAMMMAMMIGVMKLAGQSEKGINKGIRGMLTMAIALTLLIIPLKVIGAIPWIKLLSSLGALSLILLTLIGLNKILSLAKVKTLSLLGISASLIVLSIGLLFFSTAILALGSIPFKTLAIGLGALVATLVLLGLAARTLTASTILAILAISVALIILSNGLLLFSAAILALGSIPFKTLAIGLGAMVATLVLLGLAAWALKASGSIFAILAISVALIILSNGLLLFSVAILALGSIPFTTLAIGLGAMVATLVLLGLAAWALTASGAIFAILGLAISFAVFAVSIFLLATALTMLIGVMTVSAAVFAAGMIAISNAIIIAAPTIMAALWEIVEGILLIVIKSIPLVVEALTTLILEILKAIDTIIPPLIETIKNLLNQLLEAIETIFPTIINTLVTLFLQLFDALITNIPIFVDKMVDLFVTLLRSLAARLPEVMIELALLIAALVDGAVAAIVILIPRMINAGFNLIIGLLDGIGNAIVERAPELRESINRFCKNIWEAILSFFSMKSLIKKMKEIGGDLIEGLKSGMIDAGNKIKDAVKGVVNKVTGWFKDLFGINSPSKVFSEMGMFLDLGLAKGIKDYSDSAYDAAQGLGDDTAEGVEKSGLSKVLTDLNKSLESDFDNEVVIRPVLDLSEIQNGKNRLSNMMSDVDSYDISGSNLIANRTRDEINRDSTKISNNSKDGSGQGVSNSEVINNTFHITGANAKDIADEVSRVLQIQVDRRKAKWAL